MLRLLAVLVACVSPAFAEPVRVDSGEHSDFSRLVLSLPEPADWRVGRTATGYELSVEGSPVQYDVSRVFDLIPRTRLSGIFADPETGHLNLSVGCDCHAIPFALNASTIVIDLRDGMPPATSAFETGLDGRSFAPLQSADTTNVRPQPRPRQVLQAGLGEFDWTKVETPNPQASFFPWLETTGEADSIRQVLVEQLADGAARSVIELSIPPEPAAETELPSLTGTVPIRISNEVGLQVYADRLEQDTLQPDGEICLSDAQLNVAEWGSPEVMGVGIYHDLVGEFDAPNPPEISSAVKQLLYLGFGAEARAMLRAYPLPSEEQTVLHDLAVLLDDDPLKRPTSFDGMAGCDSAAALWAFLATNPADIGYPNLPAINRTFSALPPHLRGHLGHSLVERLVAIDEVNTAIEISQAMQRGIIQDEASIALAAADVLISTGAVEKAVDSLESIASTPGVHQARAIAALVQARVAAEEPVTVEEAETLAAFVEEYTGSPLHAELVRAYGLALAGSGQFEDALALGQEGLALDPAVWEMLSKNSTDDQLLSLAILPPERKTTRLAAEQIADRLEGLGFNDQASLWRVTHELSDMEIAGAWQTVSETDVETVAAEVRADRWREDWPSVIENEDGLWAELAQAISPSNDTPDETTLEGATSVLQQSKDTRALVSALFSQIDDRSESQ
jgi:tetratricopeptide (TPR) repeat protein